MDNDLQLGSAVMAKAARRTAETVVGRYHYSSVEESHEPLEVGLGGLEMWR